MAKNKDAKNDKRTNDESLVGTLLNLPYVILCMLLVSAFVSSVIEVLGIMFDWWAEPGIKHSQIMLQSEVEYLRVTLAKNAITYVSGLSVQTLFDSSIGKIFVFFNSVGLLEQTQYKDGIGVYVGAVLNIFLITFLRFFVFLFSFPLYLIFGYVAFSVGIFERDKRRAGGGRESGTIFQLAKSSIAPSISVALFIYLAWPDSINPVFVFFPSAVVFAISIAYMTASYKKYT
ncbi:DUF4400 domain-containing protein [Pseudoalteromonas luteoviolacea]|uniref:Integrating conjugative element membrane protein n=1 Tax=Pseudoalteromonas luteoviolacea S4060-1 TaxID=1365257 RepID=A0A162BKB7_9GAMM|nr:DUF4400 domain-containing protein [Pseudoalteromonas luteoviolacea]KZN63376.1 hypothetical protein N478_03745 [Pseudoalteromonas luteoviolacea S4060-1]